jgi:hypothetical protein
MKINGDAEFPADGKVHRTTVRATRESLPAPEALIGPWMSLSVRSTLSQLGIEVQAPLERLRDGKFWEQLSSDGAAPLEIDILNHGYRDVQVLGGDDIFRLYLRSHEGRYEGRELASFITSKEVFKGEYGTAWWLLGRTNDEPLPEERWNEATVACLPYDPKHRLWVPPAREPIRVAKRSDLEQYIEPMPSNMDPDFFLSETRALVQMAEEPGTLLTTSEDDTNARHTQSNLIDPQFGRPSGGKPIRLEILDRERRSHEKPWVYLELWPVPGERK